MISTSVARLGRIAALSLFVMLGAACAGDAVGPEAEYLSGTYRLSDWLYVIGGDTLGITDDSYIRIRFLDGEHVQGEGSVWLRVPMQTADGEVEHRRVPILFARQETGAVVPLEIEGWYYLDEGEPSDTLRFRFAKGAGADSWLESFAWILDRDRSEYRIEHQGIYNRLRIVHRRQ